MAKPKSRPPRGPRPRVVDVNNFVHSCGQVARPTVLEANGRQWWHCATCNCYIDSVGNMLRVRYPQPVKPAKAPAKGKQLLKPVRRK